MPDAGPSAPPGCIDAADCRQQLDRILSSPAFRATPRRRAFLKYVVEEDAAGRAGALKGYAIAVTVYGRDPSFDTRLDPLVRIEAGRLRADLEHYYQTAGAQDPLLIDIPKGANTPRYTWRTTQESAGGDAPARPVTIAGASQGEGEAKPRSRQVISRQVMLIPALLAGLAIGASFGALMVLTRPKEPLLDGKMASIAVLPFSVHDGDSRQDYFARGLSQELAKNLSQFTGLSVIPPSSVNLSQQADPPAFRRSLGTKTLVEGSVQKTADNVRVSARLIDVATGALLWGESYQRPLQADQILDIEDEIAGRIAATIAGSNGVLARAALQASMAKEPGSLGAFDCVLRFYQHQTLRTQESHAQVRACLEATTRFEPNYAEAWASLAQIYAQEYRIGFNPRAGNPPALSRAREAAERALELAPSDAGIMMVRAGTLFDAGDFSGFRRMAEAAIKLRPGDPDLLAHFGLRIATSGDWRAGVTLVRRAIDMSGPHHPGWYDIPIILGRYLDQDYAGALAAVEGMPRISFLSADFFAAMIHGEAGQTALARAAGERVRREQPNIAQLFWPVFRAWHVSEPTLERFADGLRKAGVPIDPLPPTASQ